MLDYDHQLFNIAITSGPPAPGALLVAEPFLKDQYFSHAVICLVDYTDDTNSMGIVINRATGYDLGELLEGVKATEHIPVFCGGPMSCDRLYFLHTLGDIIPGARCVSEGLYVGGDFDVMLEYVNSGYPIEGKIRFFVGYSGWDVNQLKGELRQNVWAVTSIPDLNNLLCGSGDAYWHRTVRSMGDRYRGWLYHPQNPQSN